MNLDPEIKDKLIELVRQAAKTEILPRFRKLSEDAIRSKSAPDDLVTDADIAAERYITNGVKTFFDEAVVVGEEAVAQDPQLLDLIASSEWTVIVDPVDGTWNFANGLTLFGVILAVTHKGKTCFGMLYDPIIDDWIIAEKGEGAWFCSPDAAPRRLNVAEPAKPESMTGVMPLYLFSKEQQARLASTLPTFNRVSSLRCSCHEYRLMAQGKIDFMMNGSMKPWDHAAGALIVSEAGGVARCLDGSPYTATQHTGSFLVTVDEGSFERLQTVFGEAVE